MTLKETLQSLWDPTRDLVSQTAESEFSLEALEVQLKQLKLQIHRRLGSPYAGDYRGLFKGHGMDLKDLREYQPGDEIRKIDWNVFARTGVPHVKEHYEEKQIPVWFFVDATVTMHFGQRQTKFAYARQLVQTIGLMALEIGHRVGLILWQGTRSPIIIKPGTGIAHLQWLVHTLDTSTMDEPRLTNDPMALPNLPTLLTNRSLVFLVSDFLFIEGQNETVSVLARLSPKHEVYSLLLVDPIEEKLPSRCGWLPLCDENNHNVLWVNTSNRWLLKEYHRVMQQRVTRLQQKLSLWSRFHKVRTSENPVDVVMQLVSVP